MNHLYDYKIYYIGKNEYIENGIFSQDIVSGEVASSEKTNELLSTYKLLSIDYNENRKLSVWTEWRFI